MKRKKRKTPIEFSKKILYFMFVVVAVVTIFSMAAVVITSDTTPLSYLIPAVFGEFGVGTLFYYKKAEKENIIKLKQRYKNLQLDGEFYESFAKEGEADG